jgi:hypothetical protein
MSTITIQIDSSGPVQALDLVGQNLGDMTEPITQILKSALADAKLEVEASKGGLFGGNWAPMSPFTANPPAFLQKIGVMHPREPSALLMSTGSLAESLDPGGPGNILKVAATEGQAGTNNAAATLQQEGTSRVFDVMRFFATRGKERSYLSPGIPARPFLGWHDERLPQYDQILGDRIFRGVEGT